MEYSSLLAPIVRDPAWLALAHRVHAAILSAAANPDVPAILSDPPRLANALADDPDLADAMADGLIRRGVAAILTTAAA